MKRFSIFAIIIALCFSAQAETVIHRMHVWKDGHSVNYLINNEIDSITFSSEVLTLELTEDFVNLRVGDQHQLTANVPVSSWSSSEESVVTITQDGLVTAIAEGYAVITATADGVTQTCIIQVSPKDYITENGCYVIGEASPIKSIYDQNAMLAQMAVGINEILMDYGGEDWEYAKRDGMWEKYIYLEANKEFEIILKNGNQVTSYGATLLEQELQTDGYNLIGYKGNIVLGEKMKVEKTGFYHIILDFDLYNTLSGGPQIIVAPVNWGVCGQMNGWGITTVSPEVISTTEIVWTWENQEIDGFANFKFRDANGWRIYLDENRGVSAYTSLGENGRNGGSDIYIESCGINTIYTIKLIYNLASGDIENSYRYEIVKTGEGLMIDPSSIVYSFIGTINGNWDTDTDFTFKSKQGDHYVFELNNLDFSAGEFKIRVNHDWSRSFGAYNMVVKGVEVYGEDNIVLRNPFKGSAILEFDWSCLENNIILTFYPQ